MVCDGIEQKPARLRTRIFRTLLWVLLTAAAVAGAFVWGVSQGGKETAPIVTSDLLGEHLRSIQELSTVAYYYTNMGRFENQMDFYGWKVPFTTKSFIVSYDGVIKAGVELGKVRVEVDETGQTVTVTLPESRILSHEIPEDSIEVFYESDNLFNHITIEDYTGFTMEQKGVMEQKAVENGLLSAADEKARAAVSSYLSVLPGMDTYRLTVQ